MSRIEQLLKQQQELAAEIEAERLRGRQETLHNVKEAIKAYGFTLSELKSVIVMRKPRSPNKPSAAKKPAGTGRRGRPPKQK